MNAEKILKIAYDIDQFANRNPKVSSARVVNISEDNCISISIRLDATSVEYRSPYGYKNAYIPRSGEFDLRLLTNAIRRLLGKYQVDYSLNPPKRCYASRKTVNKQFLGYESPEIVLDLLP